MFPPLVSWVGGGHWVNTFRALTFNHPLLPPTPPPFQLQHDYAAPKGPETEEELADMDNFDLWPLTLIGGVFKVRREAKQQQQATGSGGPGGGTLLCPASTVFSTQCVASG